MKNLILISLLALSTVFASCSKKSDDPVPSAPPSNVVTPPTADAPVYTGSKIFSVTANEATTVDLKDSISDPQLDSWSLVSAISNHGDISVNGTKITFTPEQDYAGDAIISIVVKDSSGNEATINIAVSIVAPVEIDKYINVTYKGTTYKLNANSGGAFGGGGYAINTDEFNSVVFRFFDKATGLQYPNYGEVPLSVIKSLIGTKHIINSNVGTNPSLIKSDYSYSITFYTKVGSNEMTSVRTPDTSTYYVEFTNFDEINSIITGNFKVLMQNGEIVTGDFKQFIFVK